MFKKTGQLLLADFEFTPVTFEYVTHVMSNPSGDETESSQQDQLI
ncbi:MAG: hypothetical protein ABII79_08075 [bacterium]